MGFRVAGLGAMTLAATLGLVLNVEAQTQPAAPKAAAAPKERVASEDAADSVG